MNYKEYKNSRDLVWRVILNEGVSELPVDVVSLCRSMGIDVKWYQPLDGNSGITVVIDGKPTIFVARHELRQRQRFTIAHELGHILLGHIGMHTLVNREPSVNDNPIEQAANVFASRLLAPACVLWACGAYSAEDIMHICDISKTAAEYRAKRMTVLRQRGKFLIHPLEREVYKQFSNYIHNRL